MTIDWIAKLRHLLQTLAFCLAISSAQFALSSDKPYDMPLVYSLAIGTSTWAWIDFGRHLAPSSIETGWPRGWAGLMLVVTGMYDVRTAETGNTAFDTGTLALVTTTNAPIESVLALTNLTPRTTWTAINHPVTASVAGMTVRLRMTSSNDFTAASSFYFDSLGLMATVCGP